MNLSILIHTFNQYEFLWDECLESWKLAYAEYCPFYFGTDTESHGKHDFGKFDVLYSGVGSWSDLLTVLLNLRPTDYVFYCQEDHWLTKPPPYLSELMKLVEDNNPLRLQISPVTRFYTLNGTKLPLFFDQKSKYLVS